ncbi:MAG TPA: hypothetical protein VEU96_11520 [Bryobacteraceae bacterium]|nr:hypothetical protein [Bryobacteraceae bacterium]
MVRVLFLLLSAAVASWADRVVIDSPRLVYATYVNNGPGSVVNGLAVDSQGFAYVVGAGPQQGAPRCAFLRKLNQTGTAAVWSVCLPMYQIISVALDAAGNIYVMGDEQENGSSSRVLKLSPDGQQTLYSTPILAAHARALAVDLIGSAYIGGVALTGFNVTPGALQAGQGGDFALKLNTRGAIEYAAAVDMGVNGIAVDSKGQVWLVGGACIDPTASPCPAGTASAIRKLDASGAHTLVSMTFGGGGVVRMGEGRFDNALGVAVDSSDSAWVVGYAEGSRVPTTPNALEPARPLSSSMAKSGIGGIGYALKLSASGDLIYGTYVGSNPGVDDYFIGSVAIDSQGNPYFGLTRSENFTWLSPVMALSSDGAHVLFSGLFNGPMQAIALDGKGGIYIGGSTIFLLTTQGAYQPHYPGGAASGFAAKIDVTGHGPYLSAFVNAADQGQSGAVMAPGELITVYGNNLPPAPKVTFDGVSAPILYADSHQINLVVPFEVKVAGTYFSAEGVADYGLAVFSRAPGLFTADASGIGQLAALNQDGSVNSSSNPAAAGSVVSVFLTGAGATTPPLGNGELGPLQPPFPTPLLPVDYAAFSGLVADVLFVGQAPGLIAGVVQVNLRIPPDTRSGNAELVLTVRSFQAQGRTTIAVK